MTNTELLMKALGWQGGTVHQVARETGITVCQVLDLHTFGHCVYNTPRRRGYRDASQGKIDAAPAGLDTSELISYWYGVIQFHRGYF
jgi:hypothetical protein